MGASRFIVPFLILSVIFPASIIGESVIIIRRKPPSNSAQSRLLRWLPYMWNVPDGLNNDNQDNATNLNSEGGNGQSDGTARNASASGAGQFRYNNNAPKNLDGRKVSPKNDSGGKGGPAQNQGNPQAFPKWWPMCVFFDPGVPNANDIVKGMVEMSAKCQVNLDVYAYTLSPGYPADDDRTLLSLEKQSCNMPEGGIRKGSTQVFTRSEIAADKMCGNINPQTNQPNEDVAGCAELNSGGMDPNQLKKARGNGGHEKMNIGGGPVNATIVDQSGWNAAVGSHEGVGHAEMGLPNGSEAGNGIGSPNGKGGDPAPDGKYTDYGCSMMFAQALPNDGSHVFDPRQTTYFAQETDPQFQFHLGDKIWHASPPGGGTPVQPPRNPPIRVANGENSSPSSNDVSETSSEMFKAVGSAAPNSGGPTRHRKVPNSGASSSAFKGGVLSLRRGTKSTEGEISETDQKSNGRMAPTSPPGDMRPPKSKGYAYKSDAPKNVGGGSSRDPASGIYSGEDAFSSTDMPEEGPIRSSGFGYDNNAPKSLQGSSSPLSSSNSGQSKGSVGLDNNVSSGEILSTRFFDSVDESPQRENTKEPKKKRRRRDRTGNAALRRPGNYARDVQVKYGSAFEGSVNIDAAEPTE